MVSSQQLPDTLSRPRPPTPPKEHASSVDDDLGDIIESLSDTYQVERAVNPRNISQPVDAEQRTPPSSADHTTRSGRRTKKVDFSPWSRFHKNKQSLQTTPDNAAPIKPLPPSRTLSAAKSILKASSLPSPNTSPATPQVRLCSTQQHKTFSDMLDAVLCALASDERDVRLDAYFTLLRTLGAQKNVPEAETLRPKAAQLMQYILRDTSTVNSMTNAPDSQLTGEACKLLSVLMRTQGVTDTLGDDICNSILKKCILSIEDINASKAIVRHHLFLLAEQRFSTRVMTVERVDRILHVLQNIDERYPGNSAVAMRLLIFKRLAEQCPDYMGIRVADWLEHIFHGMLSSLEEIRSRAVDAGTTIALATGNNPDTSKALMNLFNQEGEGGTTYGDYVSSRLLSMLNCKSKPGEKLDTKKTQQARHVPQIWAVAILYFRARHDRLTTWSHFKLWLNIISQCFNSSDIQTKFHASVAWNRLVYVLMPSAHTEAKLYNMLKQPMSAQLGTKGLDKFNVAIRKYAFGSYCNLLHYAFRPNATYEDCSRAWGEYVPSLLELLSKRADSDRALEVVKNLMMSGASNVWNEYRANEPPFVLELQDLPHLEPHWIRQNVDQILRVLGPLLNRSEESTSDALDSPAMQTWNALLRAIVEAGSKEITVSKDLKGAIARLLEFWFNNWPSEAPSFSTSQVARHLAFGTSMFEIIGPRHFLDIVLKRRVAGQAETNTFEVVSTPTVIRNRGSVDSALGHIVRFLCATRDSETESLCAAAAKRLIAICATARKGNDQDFESLVACVSEMDSRVQASSHEKAWDESDNEAEPPRVPHSLKSPLARIASATPSPMRSARRSRPAHLVPPAPTLRKTTPRKLRHEDSQIEFAAIHSSPPDNDCADESQHLTAHQKEVRERQQDEAAGIFSDLSAISDAGVLQGPSVNVNRLPPRPSSARRMQEKLRASAAENVEEPDRPSTPSLPLPEIGMTDDLLTSSPVRDASERRSQSSQRSSSLPLERPLGHSTAVQESFFDLPSSSPPHYKREPAANPAKNNDRFVEDVPNEMVVSSFNGDDTVLDTATEIADEIIERTRSPAGESIADDSHPLRHQNESEASQLNREDSRHELPTNMGTSSSSAAEHVDPHDPHDTEDGIMGVVRSRASSAAITDPPHGPAPFIAQAETEAQQSVHQLHAPDSFGVSKSSSLAQVAETSDAADMGAIDTASKSPAMSQLAGWHDDHPAVHIEEAIDSISAIDKTPRTDDAALRSSDFDANEQVISDSLPSLSQGLKRRTSRSRRQAKLQNSDSVMSASSQGSSANPQSYTAWKFYSNDDPEVQDHIVVQIRDAKRAPRRVSKRSSREGSRKPAQSVLRNHVTSPVSRRLTRSASRTSDSSGNSPISRRTRTTSSSKEGRLKTASQSSSAMTNDANESTELVESSQPRRLTPLVQVVRTPAGAPPTTLRRDSNGNENSQPVLLSTQASAPSRKRKREPSIDQMASSPATETTPEPANGCNHTPVQPKVQSPSDTPNSGVRSILSPASLLRGLRGILEGCRNAVMGSQEEREVDNMLFEIRREVHEAGRRAKRRKV